MCCFTCPMNKFIILLLLLLYCDPLELSVISRVKKTIILSVGLNLYDPPLLTV